MTSPILVTGGTGTLGRRVVSHLRDTGCDVRVLSRRSHDSGHGIQFMTGDLATGKGIEAAVDGIETIVHCAGSAKGDEDKARNLVRAVSSQTRLPHLVYISVVGADRIPTVSRVDRAMFGYFGPKRESERVVADSGLLWTTLRATQFHDLILTVVQQMAKLPLIPVPAGFRYPAGRSRRGGVPARRAHARQAVRPRARHRRATCVRDERAGPQLPAGQSPAPADHASQAPRQSRPRVPGRRQPGSRAGHGTPDVGGVPRGPGELAGTVQLTYQSTHETTTVTTQS